MVPRITGLISLGAPAHRLQFTNSKTLFLDSMQRIAVVSFGDSGRDSAIFLIHPTTLAYEKFVLPPGTVGGYGFEEGSDGNLYLGTFQGTLLRFDTRTHSFTEVAHPFSQGKLIWGSGRAPGKVYMGIYPSSEFIEYDIEEGSIQRFEPIPEIHNGLYGRTFVPVPQGILVGITGVKPSLFLYSRNMTEKKLLWEGDPKHSVSMRFCGYYGEELLFITKEGFELFSPSKERFTPLIVSLPEEDRPMAVGVDGRDIYFSGYSSGRIYRVLEGVTEPLFEPLPKGNQWKSFFIKDNHIVGISDAGLAIRVSLATGEKKVQELDLSSERGMRIQYVNESPDGRVLVGSHFINMQMFVVSEETGCSSSSLHKISQYTGQVTCGTFLNGCYYCASYGKAVLYAFDPFKPFVYSENPRMLTTVGYNQNRPVTMANDGNSLYLVTKADYGMLGGAITSFSPESGEKKVYRDFLPGHNPSACYFFSSKKWLVGSTEIFGDMGTHTPIAESASLFIWDTVSRKLLQRVEPWKADRLHLCALSPEGLAVGMDAGRYFLFNVVSGELSFGTLPEGVGNLFRKAVFLNAENLCFWSEKGLVVLNVSTGTLVPLEGAGDGRFFPECLCADGRMLALKEGVEIVKISFLLKNT
jgi:outer membrane protein assembly factor BamB